MIIMKMHLQFFGGRGASSGMSGASQGINSSDWENWALDPEPYQAALNGEKISDYLAGNKLSNVDKNRIKLVAREIQNMAESEIVSNDTLFRGESYDSLREAQRKYAVGKTITNDKLTSYATSSDIATEYASTGGKVKVVITNTNVNNSVRGSVGVMTNPLGFGGSSEVITPKGMKSKVFSSYYDKDSNTLYVGATNNTKPKKR